MSGMSRKINIPAATATYASEQESMWPYVADIQRDFAARVDWVSKDKKEDVEHMPQLKIEEGL